MNSDFTIHMLYFNEKKQTNDIILPIMNKLHAAECLALGTGLGFLNPAFINPDLSNKCIIDMLGKKSTLESNM